jgi:hypothetical protein
MSTTATFSGVLKTQPTDEAQPLPVPFGFTFTYTQQAMVPIDYATTQTDVAVSPGSITAPKLVVLQVLEGVMNLKHDTDAGTIATAISMAADPPPDQKGLYFLFTPVGVARSYYFSSPGAVRARLWFFQ